MRYSYSTDCKVYNNYVYLMSFFKYQPNACAASRVKQHKRTIEFCEYCATVHDAQRACTNNMYKLRCDAYLGSPYLLLFTMSKQSTKRALALKNVMKSPVT